MTQPAKPLRDSMPHTTAFIDQMREAFGADDINAAIKAGLAGQETFYASENGLTLGTKATGVPVPLTPYQETFAAILARQKAKRP